MKNLIFDPMNFIDNLKYMGIGMLGVILIVGIIMGATYLTNHIINKMANKNGDDSAE